MATDLIGGEGGAPLFVLIDSGEKECTNEEHKITYFHNQMKGLILFYLCDHSHCRCCVFKTVIKNNVTTSCGIIGISKKKCSQR